VDVTRPTLSIVTHSGIAINHDITIKASEPVTGVNANTVRVVLKGTKAPIAGSLRQGATPTLWVFKPAKPLDTGGTYVLNVLPAVADLSGNGAVVSGAGVRTTLLATNRSKGWNYSSSWHRHSASGARSGSFEASAAGGTATINVVGSEFDLYGCKAPNMGTIKVTAGGHTTTVSEHQSFTRCGVLILHKPLPSGEQRVKVTVAHNQGSIDELKVR